MKSKKIVAGTMAFILAVMGTGMSASAADTAKVSGSETEAKVGEEFSIDVSLAGVPASGLNTLDFAVKYDSSIVSVTGVEEGAAAKTGSDEKEPATSAEAPTFDFDTSIKGVVNVVWTTGVDSTAWIKKDGVFLTIKGTVNSTAKAGDVSNFEIVPINRPAYEGSQDTNKDIVFSAVTVDSSTDYTADTKAGKLTVIQETEKPTEAPTTEAPTTEKPTETPTTEGPTEGPSGSSDVMYGDVNVDGVVNISDVILLNKSLTGSATLSDRGRINANADQTDAGITTNDSVAILRFMINVIKKLPITK